MMRRVMCVWCPQWPIQRRLSAQPELKECPLILFAETRRTLSVTGCSSEASEWGIQVGMPLGEARSLLPVQSKRSKRLLACKPVFQRADGVADREKLRTLALDFQRYSPLVGLEDVAAPEVFWVDLSGSEALFGGERELAHLIHADLARQGIQVRIAIADTLGTAWAMSHCAEAPLSIVPTGQQAQAIAGLPIRGLRIPDGVVDSLRSLDVLTIGQLMKLPRTTLPSRFGKELVRRLDQALGLASELMTAERLVEPICVDWLFEDPVTDRQVLDQVCDLLLERVLSALGTRQAALRELTCHWLGTTESMSLRLLRPTLDRRYLIDLLRLQCERSVFTSGVTGVRMEVLETGIPSLRQALLFDEETNEREERSLVELVDRLSSRLGRQSVLRSSLFPDPLPEYSCQDQPWLNESMEASRSDAVSLCLRCRPFRLLREPRLLHVDQYSRQGLPARINQSLVVSMNGPERIESGWWRGPDMKRDYYRFDLATGARLWAFCDRNNGQWFLHGLFS